MKRKLKKWLVSNGLSQSGLAAKLGCRPSTVCMWLAGTRTPNRDLALALQAISGLQANGWRMTK
jgi:transcriptional regulator with XRE-family HTH domain